jgi:2-dehydro-3-deoxyphosphogluconate aldolase/(4S)-4-hydroxy-2-oxoglutarate aldolase
MENDPVRGMPDRSEESGAARPRPTLGFILANNHIGTGLNPEIARLCNRRKDLYIPGCATETEIATAEELGAEIGKIFPADAAGGPKFISAVMASCPWHRLLPTGGVDETEESVKEWTKAGAAVLGMGSKLITPALVAAKDCDGLAVRTGECIGWIKKARA